MATKLHATALLDFQKFARDNKHLEFAALSSETNVISQVALKVSMVIVFAFFVKLIKVSLQTLDNVFYHLFGGEWWKHKCSSFLLHENKQGLLTVLRPDISFFPIKVGESRKKESMNYLELN